MIARRTLPLRGPALTMLRRGIGLTIEDLAAELGWDREKLRDLEGAAVTFIPSADLRRIVRALSSAARARRGGQP